MFHSLWHTGVRKNLVSNIESAIKFSLISYSKNDTSQVKELLYQNNVIQLEQYFNTKINNLFSILMSKDFILKKQEVLNLYSDNSDEMYEAGIEYYFLVCKPTLEDFVQLAAYGNDEQAQLVSKAIKYWLDHLSDHDQAYTIWRFLPSLFLIYTVGITALEKEKWAYIKAIFYDSKTLHPARYNSRDYVLTIVTEFTTLKYTSLNSYQNNVYRHGHFYEKYLNSILEDIMVTKTEYYQAFDLFEFTVALHILYLRSSNPEKRRIIKVPTNTKRSEDYIVEKLENWGKEGDNFGLLEIGFFDGSFNAFADILFEYYQIISDTNSPFSTPISNYKTPYKQGLAHYLRSL